MGKKWKKLWLIEKRAQATTPAAAEEVSAEVKVEKAPDPVVVEEPVAEKVAPPPRVKKSVRKSSSRKKDPFKGD